MARLYHQRLHINCIYVSSLHDFMRMAGTRVFFLMKLSFSCHVTFGLHINKASIEHGW